MEKPFQPKPGGDKHRGFTLVELLVVMGIIALLISILLPTLNSAKQYSDSIKCQSNLRNVGQMLLMYAQDNRGIPFPVGPVNSSGFPLGLGTNVEIMERWTVLCFGQNKPNPKVMICPIDMYMGAEDMKDPYLNGQDPNTNKHSYILNKHLVYEDIRFGKPLRDYHDYQIVVAGEKKTDYFDYYMECTVNTNTMTLTNSDFYKIEPTRHGAKYRSNTLYLDTHVDNKDPYKLVTGKYIGTTPVDSSFVDPWQVRPKAVEWTGSKTTPTPNPNPNPTVP